MNRRNIWKTEEIYSNFSYETNFRFILLFIIFTFSNIFLAI